MLRGITGKRSISEREPSLSDVFKDNEPLPLHSLLTLTHAHASTHYVKHLKAHTQCGYTCICPRLQATLPHALCVREYRR